ncbi:MAG: serine esterase [Verrucomicrobia bacterium]|nr:serine esterase [Verrucomicrobiota bacterium]
MKALDTTSVSATERDSRRLMIVLHGLGDSSAGYEWLPAMMRLPWMNYLLVNAPDEYYGGYSWFDIYGDAEPGVMRSLRLLDELLDAQRSKGFPTEQTVLFGFSQGCLMTLETGLRYPHRFAGLVGISGFLLDPERLLRELPPIAREQRLLVTHGTEDPLLPIAATRDRIKILQKAGLAIEWREFPKAHTIDGETELSVIREFVRARFSK